MKEEEELLEERKEEEIGKAIEKMKEKKAAEIDEIPTETWRHGGLGIKQGITNVIKQV